MKNMHKVGRIVIWLVLTLAVMAGGVIALCTWSDWPILGNAIVFFVIPNVSMFAYYYFVNAKDTAPAES